MGEILLKILEMNLYGSIAILVVLLFRFLCRRLPKRITIVFWLAVALRLLCPFNFSAATSVFNYVDKTAIDGTLHQMTGVAIERFDDSTVTVSTAPEAAEDKSGFPVSVVVTGVWVSVASAMLIYSSVKYRRMNRFLKTCRPSADGRFYVSDVIDSPFVTGILRPKVCVPAIMDESEKSYILAHEMMHIKNHDCLIKYLSYVILSINWFNPLVWVAFFMLCSDIEMRADEEVADQMDLDSKKAYCISIVNHALDIQEGTALQNTAFSGLGFGGREAKRRVKNLLTYTKISRILAFFVLLITIAASILASACGSENDPVQTMLTEASTIVKNDTNLADLVIKSSVDEDYTNEDGFNYKSNKGMRQLVELYRSEGLKISAVEPVYDAEGNCGHQVVMVNKSGEVKKIIADIAGLTGVLAEHDMGWYEGKNHITALFDDEHEAHPIHEEDDGIYEFYIEEQILVTSK